MRIMKRSEVLIADFLQSLKFVLQLSNPTIKAYGSDLELFSNYCEQQQLDLLTIDSTAILEYLALLNESYASSSVARMMSSLHHFYKWLVLQRYLSNDPTSFISVKIEKPTITNFLTHEEFLQLVDFKLEKPNDYLDRTLLELLYGSGLRVSEAISLQFKQIIESESLINVIGKGQKQRLVPFSKIFYDVYQLYLVNYRDIYKKSGSQYIFINRKSMPISRQIVYNIITKRAKSSGLNKKATPHVLRHSFASALIGEGANLRAIQELLGHADIATTQIYTHLEMEKKREMFDRYHPLNQRKKDKNEI